MSDLSILVDRLTKVEREVARLASIEDPSVPLASLVHRPLRVGEDPVDWPLWGMSTPQTHIPDTMRMIIGSTYVESANQFVPFPENYTGLPVVFTQPDGVIGVVPLVTPTVSGFFIYLYADATSTSGGLYWLALGPVDV